MNVGREWVAADGGDATMNDACIRTSSFNFRIRRPFINFPITQLRKKYI